MLIKESFQAGREAGEEAITVGKHTVPLLTDSEFEIFVRYQGLGRDMNGRALVAEQDAMLRLMRRMGYRFSDADILECWDALAGEEAEFRGEKSK